MRSTRFLAAVLVFVACSSAPETDPETVLPPTETFSTSSVTVHGDEESASLAVHVAADAEARQLGLMHRDELPERAGMLFTYPAETHGGFWMKNTRIPLSIAFLDEDGTIVAALDMEPCEADPCPTYEPGVAYRHALEVNQGLFDELGADEGDRVDLPDDLPEPE